MSVSFSHRIPRPLSLVHDFKFSCIVEPFDIISAGNFSFCTVNTMLQRAVFASAAICGHFNEGVIKKSGFHLWYCRWGSCPRHPSLSPLLLPCDLCLRFPPCLLFQPWSGFPLIQHVKIYPFQHYYFIGISCLSSYFPIASWVSNVEDNQLTTRQQTFCGTFQSWS